MSLNNEKKIKKERSRIEMGNRKNNVL